MEDVADLKITVVGAGYVGMSLGVLFSREHHVTFLDIDPERVKKINDRQSTVADVDIDAFLADKDLDLRATMDSRDAYSDSDYVIVATPTNYSPELNEFDTSSVDAVVTEALAFSDRALIVIKSTVPVGYTQQLQSKFGTDRVVFSPEFLREGSALSDNLYPSRIIVGSYCSEARRFSQLLADAAETDDVKILHMSSTEAEAVKLFANTYLAMRVSFFNELDTFSMYANLATKNLIEGVSSDPRIGFGYNNPSFGYGGYCLPKDTQQLLANYKNIPQKMIQAIVDANDTRKTVIADWVIAQQPRMVGFYRLAMKSGSDNFRSSAIQGIIDRVLDAGIKACVYEPLLGVDSYKGVDLVRDLERFKAGSDIIICNRMAPELESAEHKVFSRDLFNEN